MIGHRPPDWTEKAACVGLTTRERDIFTPADHLTAEERAFDWHLARRICAGCPVRLDCAVDALGSLGRHDEYAMRGGLTPDELIELAKGMGLKWRREAQHGTRSKYVAGCDAGPDGGACADCKDAHRVYEHERRLWAKERRRARLSAREVFAWLAEPRGRGKHRAEVGQLLLFTDGLPQSAYARPELVAS